MNSIHFPQEDIGQKILIAGGGGFIGGWLARSLRESGYQNVRVVDIKPQVEWFQTQPEFENIRADLQSLAECRQVTKGVDVIYNLAADMGGMGFIESNKALCMLSSLINTHLLIAAHENEVQRYFFSSSACVYNADKQLVSNGLPLKEEDAYPAMPEDGYGWEKLFSERMVRHFGEDFGILGRVGRYHNVYGPEGTWDGGREKAPAAICRKVIEAKLSGNHEILIWGDGEQTRSFTFIDDAIYGTRLLTASDVSEPLNIGSDQLVSINQLVSIVENIAGIKLNRKYLLDAPKGVKGRNSDNSKIRSMLDWSPSTKLELGMEETFRWVFDQVVSRPSQL